MHPCYKSHLVTGYVHCIILLTHILLRIFASIFMKDVANWFSCFMFWSQGNRIFIKWIQFLGGDCGELVFCLFMFGKIVHWNKAGSRNFFHGNFYITNLISLIGLLNLLHNEWVVYGFKEMVHFILVVKYMHTELFILFPYLFYAIKLCSDSLYFIPDIKYLYFPFFLVSLTRYLYVSFKFPKNKLSLFFHSFNRLWPLFPSFSLLWISFSIFLM